MLVLKRTVIVLMIIIMVSIPVFADQPDFKLSAKSAILMEAETGEILYEKNSHQELPPASMTKIMTMLLVMEAIEEGRANLQDKILVSERAASMGGSQVYLETGEEMTLAALMKAIAISSANDASVAVAEYIYGTEKEFIKQMNKKAKELNLKNTYFYNTNGLPPEDPEVKGNYTSAHDLAIMTREILKYPRVLKWTSTWIDYLRDGEFVLNNTNRLVRFYNGADGLKTGHTEAAKFCLTSTARRNGLRFISVVMGVPDSKTRFQEAAKLLSYGFNIYENFIIAERDDIIEKIKLITAKDQMVEIVPDKQISVPLKRGEKDKVTKKVIIDTKLKPPVASGEKVGEIVVYKDGSIIKRGNLITNRNIEKASILQMMKRFIININLNLMNLVEE